MDKIFGIAACMARSAGSRRASVSTGTPFTNRGFENIPALGHLEPWLAELRAAA